MLKFIGSESAFNTQLGNHSAYYQKNQHMLLIDCGSNTIHRIWENHLLEGIEHASHIEETPFYSIELHMDNQVIY